MIKKKKVQGIYGIWKSKGPTSREVVSAVKKITKEKKVGHAGTLDPLAEGVLVVAVGRENTKKIDHHRETEKEYLAKIKLGKNSTTDDEEGEKTEIEVDRKPELKEIKEAANCFVGDILQKAPRYSAVKIAGQEGYKRARRGEDFPLPPRNVEIKKIDILKYEWPIVEARVVTGPGVYIRSLARDVGQKLGTGGYLADLVRTRVGEFKKKDCLTLEEFQKKS